MIGGADVTTWQDLYAWYGYAVACYQPIEELYSVILVLGPSSTALSRAKLNELIGQLSEAPLERLWRRLEDSGQASKEAFASFRPVLGRRNELVHRYFRVHRRAQKAGTPQGRAELVRELGQWSDATRDLGFALVLGIVLTGAWRSSQDELLTRLAKIRGEKPPARLAAIVQAIFDRPCGMNLRDVSDQLFPPQPSR
jgi:hypothetical protein